MHMEDPQHTHDQATMKVEDLNKTQLLLLALLVSFVTSIATGIVTVTLMDQAPPGVTQTINRVIEKTVQVVAPESDEKQVASVIETIVVKEEDFIVEATNKNAPNVVAIGYDTVTIGEEGEEVHAFEAIASGVIVSAEGYVITDKARLPEEGALSLKTIGGQVVPLEVRSLDHVDLALLAIVGQASEEAKEDAVVLPMVATPELVSGGAVHVGQRAIVLGMEENTMLTLGTVSTLSYHDDETLRAIIADVDAAAAYSGGALVDTNGLIAGISIITSDGGYSAVPADDVFDLIASLTTPEEDPQTP